MDKIPNDVPPDQPILIAGPTASGKSSLALRIAETHGGEIINADALQVYDCWRLLTARPDAAELARAPHHLYGHMGWRQDYSVGTWLRDVATLLKDLSGRPIIVGGTGLYFQALTEGLADIPNTPAKLRAEADQRLAAGGLAAMVAELDAATRAKIDTHNPKRVQRAWEVLQNTGRGIADWQAETPPALLPLAGCHAIAVVADKDWLNQRIDRRFEQMMAAGALEEVRAVLDDWDPARLSAKAIGAAELVAHLRGELSLSDAVEQAKLATRQYAKRQRSWLRSRGSSWHCLARP